MIIQRSSNIIIHVALLMITHLSILLQTPLHSACIKGDLQCVEMLLEHVSCQLSWHICRGLKKGLYSGWAYSQGGPTQGWACSQGGLTQGWAYSQGGLTPGVGL